jgi:uncharacterized RDD family membrane protein YckC
MQQSQGPERIVTPEAVALTLDLAGLGSRMIAIAIDMAIQVGVFLLLSLSFAGLGLQGTSAQAMLLVSFFLLFWGYFFVFEGMWNGQTPGKRMQRIRVVRSDGQPAGWSQVVIRNLVRIVDLLPGFYAIGTVSIVLTRRSQRLGDLAGGTVVTRLRGAPAPFAVSLPPDSFVAARTLDTAALTESEYSLIRSFLERRGSLVPAARERLAAELTATIRPRVAGAGAWAAGDEALLEAVSASYRARYRPSEPVLPAPPPA